MPIPTVTNNEILAVASAQTKQQAAQVENQLKQVLTRSFNSLWKNPNPILTPDAQIAQWGTGAVALVTSYEALAAFVKSVDPAFVVPVPSRSYTKNPDGTVTLVTA